MNNRKHNKYIERVITDLDILKKAHELGIANAPDEYSNYEDERLSRVGLIQKIKDKRQSLLQAIENTEGVNTRTRKYWKDKLTNIDLFNPEAEQKVQELYGLLEDYYNDLPADYGGYKSNITLLEMNIGIIQTDLINLRNLCSAYTQETD